MFTVTVSRLPEDCTEEEITAHFGTICPSHKIANISMAFDNRLEIEECTKRGDLIRAKVRAVHVSILPSLSCVRCGRFVLRRALG
jgi:exosome complex RNA-binding protein Csl4